MNFDTYASIASLLSPAELARFGTVDRTARRVQEFLESSAYALAREELETIKGFSKNEHRPGDYWIVVSVLWSRAFPGTVYEIRYRPNRDLYVMLVPATAMSNPFPRIWVDMIVRDGVVYESSRPSALQGLGVSPLMHRLAFEDSAASWPRHVDPHRSLADIEQNVHIVRILSRAISKS